MAAPIKISACERAALRTIYLSEHRFGAQPAHGRTLASLDRKGLAKRNGKRWLLTDAAYRLMRAGEL